MFFKLFKKKYNYKIEVRVADNPYYSEVLNLTVKASDVKDACLKALNEVDFPNPLHLTREIKIVSCVRADIE